MPSKVICGDGVGSNNASKALTEYEVSSLSHALVGSTSKKSSLRVEQGFTLNPCALCCVCRGVLQIQALPFDLSIAYLALAFLHVPWGALVATATQAASTISSHS